MAAETIAKALGHAGRDQIIAPCAGTLPGKWRPSLHWLRWASRERMIHP